MTCPMAPQWGVVPETGIEPVRPCGRGIFLPLRLSPPARKRRSWSGARLHHSLLALGARRLLSTPSPAFQPGLGSALARNRSRAFAEFDGLHLWSFPQRAQISLSPLCLPISPLGRCAAHAGPAAGVTIPSWGQGYCRVHGKPGQPRAYFRPNKRPRNPRGAAAASSAAWARRSDRSWYSALPFCW